MIIDIKGKSIVEIVEFLKIKEYVPCLDTGFWNGTLDCPESCGGYCETDECYEHEKYDVRTYKCDCGTVFYEITAKQDELPDKWDMIDGVQVGLK